MPDVVAVIEPPPTPVAVTVVEEVLAVQEASAEVIAIPEGPIGPRGIDTNITKMTADVVPPANPSLYDLWVDIS